MRTLHPSQGGFIFKKTPMEQHLSDLWANINANWGLLEYEMLQVLADINLSESHEWTIQFLSNSTRQETLVRDELRLLTDGDKPMLEALDGALTKIVDAKKIRNALVHGIWGRKSEMIVVQPLRLDEGGFSLDPEITVDPSLLNKLDRDMDFARQRLAGVACEVLAFKELRKMDKRRALHSAKRNTQ